jgi:hypothetical protein
VRRAPVTLLREVGLMSGNSERELVGKEVALSFSRKSASGTLNKNPQFHSKRTVLDPT